MRRTGKVWLSAYRWRAMAVVIASNLGQGHRGVAPAPRRVLQARAARPDDPVRAQRVGQDDPAPDARRGDLDHGGEAVAAQGREGGPARSAAAARARHQPARLRGVGRAGRGGAGAGAAAARARDGRRRHRRADPRGVLEGPGAVRAPRRLPLARPGARDPARARLPRGRPGPQALHLLRRRAHPRRAGPGADRRAGPAAARRAHEPPGHRLAGVAGAAPDQPRRRDRAGGPRPLVPGGGRHLGARAGGRPGAVLQGPVARLAQGEGRPRDRPGPRDRAPAGRDRADGALRRALPLQGEQGAPGPVAREEAREDGPRHARPHRRPRAELHVQGAGAVGPGGVRARARADRGARQDADRGRGDGGRARRARGAGGCQRLGQDDADRDPGGPARAARRQAEDRLQRRGRLRDPARRGR